MSELEIAFVGLLILLGAAGIVYAGVRAPGKPAAPEENAEQANEAGAP